ncbi:MAG TPA: HAD family phosphatase [Candidatus Aquicultor sp.]
MDIRAFIFDIDGTLVDTTMFHIQSWMQAFEKSGIELYADDIQPQIGRRAVEIAQALLPEAGQDAAQTIVEEKWRIYKQYLPAVKPFPGVKELFTLLKERGIKTALATSTIRRDADYYSDLLSIKSMLDAVVTGEDTQRSKPDPEIFLKAAAELNVSPEHAVVVGDSPHDIKAGVAAGMFTIGVITGGYPEATLKSAGAGKIYRDIADILAHISDVL